MAELDIAAIESVAIEIVKGDDKDYEFAVKNFSGASIDVSSGYFARLQGRTGTRPGRLVIAFDSRPGNGLLMGDGKITISMLAEDTARLDAGVSTTADSVIVPFELELVKTGAPDRVKTIARGCFTVREKLVSDVPVTSIELDTSALKLITGGAVGQLSATVLPRAATDQTIVWESDNPAVAAVTKGTVSPVGAGTCMITATAGEKSATCAVTVTAE